MTDNRLRMQPSAESPNTRLSSHRNKQNKNPQISYTKIKKYN